MSPVELIVCITCGTYMGIALGVFFNAIVDCIIYKVKEHNNDSKRTSK